jgi:NADH:ubiquinone oxidoreductase subunit K
MIFLYFIAFGFALFAVGISGVVASRHFIIMMLAVEVALTASVVLAAASFTYAASGDIVGLLFTIWAIASAEIIGMVAVYRYMVAHGVSMDVRQLSKLREW